MRSHGIHIVLTMAAVAALYVVAGDPICAGALDRETSEPRNRRSRPTPRLADGKPNLGLTPRRRRILGRGRWPARAGRELRSWSDSVSAVGQRLARVSDENAGEGRPVSGMRPSRWTAAIFRRGRRSRSFSCPKSSASTSSRAVRPEAGASSIWTAGSILISPPTIQSRVHGAFGRTLGGRHARRRYESASTRGDGFSAGKGMPTTVALHLIERFSRPNFNTLRYEPTIDDPGAYTRPWSGGWNLRWIRAGYGRIFLPGQRARLEEPGW